MRVAATLLLVLSAGLIQTTLVPRLAIGGVKPDLLLASLVYIALFLGTRYGMWAGFAGGMFVDLYSPRHLGVNALVNTTICFILGATGERVFREKAGTQFVVLVTAALIHDLLLNLISLHPIGLLSRLLPGSLYTGMLGFASVQIVRRLRLKR